MLHNSQCLRPGDTLHWCSPLVVTNFNHSVKEVSYDVAHYKLLPFPLSLVRCFEGGTLSWFTGFFFRVSCQSGEVWGILLLFVWKAGWENNNISFLFYNPVSCRNPNSPCSGFFFSLFSFPKVLLSSYTILPWSIIFAVLGTIKYVLSL